MNNSLVGPLDGQAKGTGSGRLSSPGHAFRSDVPLADRQTLLSRLSLGDRIEMLGGELGRKPSKLEIGRLADLLKEEWNPRHNASKSVEEHESDILQRCQGMYLPLVVEHGLADWIDQVLHPMVVSTLPKNDKEILGEKYWNTEVREGRLIVVRKRLATEFLLGPEERLISKGLLLIAHELWRLGQIDGMVFYTWDVGEKPSPELREKELKLHEGLGALRAREFANGGIVEMIYSHLVDVEQGSR